MCLTAMFAQVLLCRTPRYLRATFPNGLSTLFVTLGYNRSVRAVLLLTGRACRHRPASLVGGKYVLLRKAIVLPLPFGSAFRNKLLQTLPGALAKRKNRTRS